MYFTALFSHTDGFVYASTKIKVVGIVSRDLSRVSAFNNFYLMFELYIANIMTNWKYFERRFYAKTKVYDLSLLIFVFI